MTHVVKRFSAQVQVASRPAADEMQDILSRFVHHRLPDVLDQHGGSEVTRIDRLEVNLGPVTAADLSNRAQEAIAAALRQHGDVAPDSDKTSETSTPLLKALVHIMQTGRSHWRGAGKGLGALLTQLDGQDPVATRALLIDIANQPHVADRLTRQLTQQDRAALSPNTAGLLNRILLDLSYIVPHSPATTDNETCAEYCDLHPVTDLLGAPQKKQLSSLDHTKSQDTATHPAVDPETDAPTEEDEKKDAAMVPLALTNVTSNPNLCSQGAQGSPNRIPWKSINPNANAPQFIPESGTESGQSDTLDAPDSATPSHLKQGETGVTSLLVSLSHGTLTDVQWAELAGWDMHVWLDQALQMDAPSVVKTLRDAGVAIGISLLANRLTQALPPSALAILLAHLAPGFGGVLGYAITVWDAGSSDDIAIAAVITAMDDPECHPSAALGKMIDKLAQASSISSAVAASRAKDQTLASPEHPAQVALVDMLTPFAQDTSASHRHISSDRSQVKTDTTDRQWSMLWAYLRFGTSADAEPLINTAQAALNTTQRTALRTLVQNFPAAQHRLVALVGVDALVTLTASATTAPVPRDKEESDLTSTAGVILLWPFLERFFQSLDLCDNGVFIDANTQRRGALLLHALCTDRATAEEPDLLLEKTLCGLGAKQATDREINLTQAEKDQSNDLLSAVRSHWSALENSTNAALQTTFLARSGRLIRAQPDAALILEVQPGPFDMLLGKLPWQISTIRLPMMREVLHVKWR